MINNNGYKHDKQFYERRDNTYYKSIKGSGCDCGICSSRKKPIPRSKEKVSIVSNKSFNVSVADELKKIHEILLKKHDDYGNKNILNTPGGSLRGLLVRLFDKVSRLDNIISNNKKPSVTDESLLDTFTDIAGYAIIGMMVLNGTFKEED